jgi:DNA replication protein DnaC
MPYIEVMRELKTCSMDEDYYNAKLWRYQRAKLLIIDDLFKDKIKKGKVVGELSEADIKHIYPIINHRYINHLPTLISSECTPYMLTDFDEALAGRIVEMCGDNVVVFNNSKYNYRMRNFIKEGN